MTLYQIAQIVNRVGGYDPHLLKGCPRIEAGPMPPRAGNVSMNSGKLQRVLAGDPFQPWPVGEELLPTHREWHFVRPPEERGGAAWLAERLYRYAAAACLSRFSLAIGSSPGGAAVHSQGPEPLGRDPMRYSAPEGRRSIAGGV